MRKVELYILWQIQGFISELMCTAILQESLDFCIVLMSKTW